MAMDDFVRFLGWANYARAGTPEPSGLWTDESAETWCLAYEAGIFWL